MTIARAGARPAMTNAQKQQQLQNIAKKVRGQPWTYYDTKIFGASAFPGDAAAPAFTTITAQTQFFNTQARGIGTQGGVLCNNSDLGKLDTDFVCYSLGVDVFCSTDCASAAGIATAQAFVETVVMFGNLNLSFSAEPIFVEPLTEMPAGGGPWTQGKVRTQTMAANSDSATMTNGVPDAQNVKWLQEPLLFPKGQAFALNLNIPTDTAGTAGPLHRLQNLQALTSDFNAVIRVKLRGVRGKPLLPGVSTNPELRSMWAARRR